MVLAAAVPLIAGMALVGLRGEIDSQITALVLVVTVVGGAQLGGRPGGLVAAVMAATSFDFFHTEPYLSLKIIDAKDIETTVLLLIVGLVVGSMADRLHLEQRFGREGAKASSALGRVLEVAAGGCAEDVALSVRAELLRLLGLQDCWFTTDTVTLTTIDRGGTIRGKGPSNLGGDFALPVEGVALPVTWNDRCFGYLAAIPVPGVIVVAENRRVAVAMAEVLGLALAAQPTAA
jgi:K+-sensing histidine kinase KdpD